MYTGTFSFPKQHGMCAFDRSWLGCIQSCHFHLQTMCWHTSKSRFTHQQVEARRWRRLDGRTATSECNTCSCRLVTNIIYTSQYKGTGKGFPYSIPSVGPGADPGVQAVSPQVTVSHPPGCHYFPPGLQLPPQPQSITALWPVPSYTAWWQRHIGVSNLPIVVTQRCLEQIWTCDLLIASPNALPVIPPRHLHSIGL